MTKQAYKDENGNIIYKYTSDRKKCLTFEEWRDILENTRLKDYQYLSGTDMKFIDGKCIRYFWCKFNRYSSYPLTIAEIHSKYGRGIEVITADAGYPNTELQIRAYNDFR